MVGVLPIFQETEDPIDAHIFVAFPACCLQVVLKVNLQERQAEPHRQR